MPAHTVLHYKGTWVGYITHANDGWYRAYDMNQRNIAASKDYSACAEKAVSFLGFRRG